MACNSCTQTSSLPNPCNTGCTSTINADCVIYNKTPLSFEDDVSNGDTRTLTEILQQIQNGIERESKFVNFNSSENTQYTLVAEDATKILMLTFTDEGDSGTITRVINLPQTSDFINKEIIIKDISSQLGNITLVYEFNIQVQYDWDTLTTTNLFYTLADSVHKTLKLRYIKTSELSYQWVVCP